MVEIHHKGRKQNSWYATLFKNSPRFSKGEMFFLTCEMRHVIILMSKNSVKIKTKSFCYLPQLSSLSSRQKFQLGIFPVCNSKEINKCCLRSDEWRSHWNISLSLFPLFFNSELPLFSFCLSAHLLQKSLSIQIWWQVWQHLQEHICQWEGATPKVDEELNTHRQERERMNGYTWSHCIKN